MQRSIELKLTRCEGNWKPTRFGIENCLKALCGFESRHLDEKRLLLIHRGPYDVSVCIELELLGYNVTVSITGFEPVRLGSNPSIPTEIKSDFSK